MIDPNQEIKELFQQKIAGLLTGGETTNTIRNTSKTRDIYEITRDGERVLVGQINDKEETKQVSLKPTPTWVLNMVEKSLSTQAAIDLLINQGYLVIDPTNKPENVHKSKTFTKDAANQIKARILGLKTRGTN